MNNTNFDHKEALFKGMKTIDLFCSFVKHHFNYHLVSVSMVDDSQCMFTFTPYSRTPRTHTDINADYWNEFLESTFTDESVQTAFISLVEKTLRSTTNIIPLVEGGGDRGLCLFIFPTNGEVGQGVPMRRKGEKRHTEAVSSIEHLEKGRIWAENISKTKWDDRDSNLVAEWDLWLQKAEEARKGSK